MAALPPPPPPSRAASARSLCYKRIHLRLGQPAGARNGRHPARAVRHRSLSSLSCARLHPASFGLPVAAAGVCRSAWRRQPARVCLPRLPGPGDHAGGSPAAVRHPAAPGRGTGRVPRHNLRLRTDGCAVFASPGKERATSTLVAPLQQGWRMPPLPPGTWNNGACDKNRRALRPAGTSEWHDTSPPCAYMDAFKGTTQAREGGMRGWLSAGCRQARVWHRHRQRQDAHNERKGGRHKRRPVHG